MDERTKAKIRATARFSFYLHLGVYVAVNVLLIAINLLVSPGNPWFWWVLGGWGIGVAIHGLALLAVPKLISLREHMIEREMAKGR